MSVLFHPGKANVVACALVHMNIGSISNVDEANKDLIKDINKLARLGVRLEDSINDSFIVNHNSKSSLRVEVKPKQHPDQQLMEYEESVLFNLNESFSSG